MKKTKSNKPKNFIKLTQRGGISLIVLVITIIVIIILAAAVILTINNNNPVAEANKARYESDRANMQAVFTTAVAKVMTHNRATISITAGQVNEETNGAKESRGTVSYTVTNAMNKDNTDGTIVFNKGQNTDTTFYTGKLLPVYAAGETKWYVDEDGTISLEVAGVKYGNGEIIKPFSQTVANSATAYYGQKVTNYTTGDSVIDSQVEWQIFYADNSNIYLIATDYIHYDICPPSANYTITKNGDYKLSMNDIRFDYPSSIYITDIRLQNLNKSYHDMNPHPGQQNCPGLAYMMDISESVWGTFAGAKADYAIGGPTIEMLMKSYSQKYSVDYRAKALSWIGYFISKDSGENFDVYYTNMLRTDDSQYVINSSDRKADAMWIASPSGYLSYNMSVHYNGTVSYCDYISTEYTSNYLGFRPLVCLNSSVTLKEVSDGYEIVL